MKHVVMYSGGVASYCAAKRVAELYGTDDLTLLFTDTRIEDQTLYVFLRESAKDVGGKLIEIADGRTPWEVFRDERMIGNTRADPCSKILKRQMAHSWIKENCKDVVDTLIHLGFDWNEQHRVDGSREAWLPFAISAPLCDKPYLEKSDMLSIVKEAGLTIPRLYEMGFPHNNCGGFCVKAGRAHFKHLLETMPELYKHHEQREQEMREYLEKDVSILRDRSKVCPDCKSTEARESTKTQWICMDCGLRYAKTRPLTLRAFRKMIESKQTQCLLDLKYDWGGCGCFAG